jgi:hypothetical protein
MKSARMFEHLLLSASALAAVILGGCMESKLASTWPGEPVLIDGKAPEWAGREAYYSENDGFKVGFFNNDRYLYVYLATWNRQKQGQILRNGLTVWIDAAGGKKETLGINYPERRFMPDSASMAAGIPAGLRGGQRSGFAPGASEEGRQAFLKAMVEEAQGELAVVGPGGEPLATMPAADDGKGGIAAMIDVANRTLIYEMRIPLASPDSLPFAVNTAPGRTIGIGFKVGAPEHREMRRTGEASPRSEGGFPGRGMGGRSGGMGGFPGGGMGGHSGSGGGASEQPLEYWAKVKLAAAPSAAQQKEPATERRR